jgi:hypothetical protein
MYEMIQAHGRTDVYLYYANVISDHERIVEYWILEEEWSKAIEIINRQVSHCSTRIWILLMGTISQILNFTTSSAQC